MVEWLYFFSSVTFHLPCAMQRQAIKVFFGLRKAKSNKMSMYTKPLSKWHGIRQMKIDWNAFMFVLSVVFCCFGCVSFRPSPEEQNNCIVKYVWLEMCIFCPEYLWNSLPYLSLISPCERGFYSILKQKLSFILQYNSICVSPTKNRQSNIFRQQHQTLHCSCSYHVPIPLADGFPILCVCFSLKLG